MESASCESATALTPTGGADQTRAASSSQVASGPRRGRTGGEAVEGALYFARLLTHNGRVALHHVDSVGPSTGTTPPSTTPIGRRIVLGMGLVGAAGIAFGGILQREVGRVVSAINPGGGGLAALIPGANQFRIYNAAGTQPDLSSAAYRLNVGGLVDNPLTFSFDELISMPATHLSKDFQCVTGWRVPGVHWVGVALSEILDRAGVQPPASAVNFGSFDGLYTESLTMDQARRPDVIVAYEMLGTRPISQDHGGPVRLYVAPMYGYKSIKWLSSITVATRAVPGYWEQNGYDVNAWIGRSNSGFRNTGSDKPIDGG